MNSHFIVIYRFNYFREILHLLRALLNSCWFGSRQFDQSISIFSSDRRINLDVTWLAPSSHRRGNRRLLFFFPLSPQRQRIRSRSAVLQNAPRGDVVLVRLYEKVSRENVRSECGGKGGFPCTHVHPSYTRHPPPPSLVSLSLSPPSTSFRSVVRQISRSYGNTMVDDVESGGGC